MTEQILKELTEKINTIDKKLNAIMKHFNIEIEKPKRAGLPPKNLIQGI